MRSKNVLLVVVAIVLFTSLTLFYSPDRMGYDTGRNQKIITELATYGTFTYFDVPFLVSPPLYFIVHSIPVSLLGSGQEIFLLTETLLYVLGALLALQIMRELGFSFRPGFAPHTQNIEIPGSGDIAINLKKDSPFITHTTANRY